MIVDRSWRSAETRSRLEMARWRRGETAVTNLKLLRFESLVEENSDDVTGTNGHLKNFLEQVHFEINAELLLHDSPMIFPCINGQISLERRIKAHDSC